MSSDNKNEDKFYPNRWPRIILETTEEIVGKNGVTALLNLAGLNEYVDNYPADNMKKEFPFEHVGKLQQAYWDMYGPRGARAFAIRAGAKTLNDGIERFGKVAMAARAAMTIGSVNKRMSIGLEFFAKFFNAVSDQKVSVEEDDAAWYWKIHVCPMCTGRTSDKPVCHLAVGVLQGAIGNFVSKDARYRITPTHCQAMGHETGSITIDKEE
ncbi:MAG: 4-vinyl reductase [Chloroflexi bacterium]|nr:4-vinyl reductase [Chloroflexota bacterium]